MANSHAEEIIAVLWLIACACVENPAGSFICFIFFLFGLFDTFRAVAEEKAAEKENGNV